MRDRRGSAVQWFAFAAAALCFACAGGVQALDWLTQPGRLSVVALRQPAARAGDDPGVDMTPTGSLPPSGVVLRLR